LIAKIFRSHFFGVVEGHGVHVSFESFIVIEAEAVQLIERAVITKSVVALIGDFLLPNQFLFRSRQFFVGNTSLPSRTSMTDASIVTRALRKAGRLSTRIATRRRRRGSCRLAPPSRRGHDAVDRERAIAGRAGEAAGAAGDRVRPARVDLASCRVGQVRQCVEVDEEPVAVRGDEDALSDHVRLRRLRERSMHSLCVHVPTPM